jgi:predicted DCC family thiol-disulfide oxidoreductase YuxK
MTEVSGERPVVLFDGVCNLCNRGVNFIIDRDPSGTFRFAALQSGAGRRILQGFGRSLSEGDPQTIVVVDRSRLYERSGAILRIARHMRGAWPLLAVLLLIPRPLRDALYRWGSARRYRWFGKSDTCRVPTQELRARFLE